MKRKIELYKVAGAILFALLLITVVRLIAERTVAPEEAPPTTAETAAPAEEAMPAEEPMAAEETAPAEEPMAAGEAAPEEAAPAETEMAALPEGDPAKGEKVFKSHLCFGCHKVEPGKHAVGPSLHNIVGREAGTVEGFGGYSDALKDSGITWTPDKLAQWIEAPKDMVSATKMVLAKPVKDPQAKADLIAYLEAQSE